MKTSLRAEQDRLSFLVLELNKRLIVYDIKYGVGQMPEAERLDYEALEAEFYVTKEALDRVIARLKEVKV